MWLKKKNGQGSGILTIVTSLSFSLEISTTSFHILLLYLSDVFIKIFVLEGENCTGPQAIYEKHFVQKNSTIGFLR